MKKFDLKKGLTLLLLIISGAVYCQTNNTIRLTSNGVPIGGLNPDEGTTLAQDDTTLSIDAAGAVTVSALDPDYTLGSNTGVVTFADALNKTFNIRLKAALVIDQTPGPTYGAITTAGGIDRAGDGAIGVRPATGTSNWGIENGEGITFGFATPNLPTSVTLQITRIYFSTFGAAESGVIVNRRDTSKKKEFVGPATGTNIIIDVDNLDLYVRGGSTLFEMASIFNNSSTPQSWRVTQIEFRLVETNSLTTVWNGSVWSAFTPGPAMDAVIQGNYSALATGGFSAKKLTINSGTLSIEATKAVKVDNEVINNAGPTGIVVYSGGGLRQVNNTVNTGAITIKRDTSPLSRLDSKAWSSPIANQNLQSFSPATLSSNFLNYDETTNQFSAVASPSTTDFAAASGYLIGMPDDAVTAPLTQTFEGNFIGITNNGDISKAITYGSSSSLGYNLVGNPYPSAIVANSFINANLANIDGSIYFYRKTSSTSGSAYAMYSRLGATNLVAGSTETNAEIPVGEGFIVKAKNNADLNFTNAMRIASVPATLTADRVWLNLTNASGVFSQALVGYVVDGTLGVDKYDGKYINDSPIALTSNIDNEEYTIQARPAFDPTDVVNLNFKTNQAGDYTIGVDRFDGVFSGGQEIYLKDNTTGTFTDLRTNSYTFTAAAGTDNSRFVLQFRAASYPIIATAGDNGSISGAGTYDTYSTATLTATPSEGYGLVNWTENGIQVSASPTYSFPVTGARTLVANFGFTNVTDVTACTSYTWNGTEYTASGIYVGQTIDGVVQKLNLTITEPTTTGSETISQCGGSYTWPVNNVTYSASTTEVVTVGCNTATLNLTITEPTTTGSETISQCGGSYTWPVNNVTYSASTTEVVTVGCNTATLNLTITEPTTEGSVTTSICSGASYTWPANGQTYTTAQNGITFVSGCNTATLNLTITEPTTTGSETISQCGGSYTWPVNNVTYTASTTEVVTEGCNTATLNLTITPATTTGSETISQCGGSYTWPVNNVTYSASTTEVVTEGCNTATLNLTITPATTTGSVTTSINAGESYTWPANGQTYTTAQNGTTFVSGCNTATLNLTVITTQIPASPYAVCAGATVATATAGTTLKFYKDTKSTTAAYAGTQKLAAATYYVTEMVSGTESARVPVEVTLTALVAPTTIASTEAKVICKYMGTSNLVTFTTTPVAEASSYSWSVPAGATIEGNATGDSITVSFEAVSGTPGLIGSVTVDSRNSLGCLSGKAKILALTTKAPTAPKTVVLTNGATVIKKAGNFVGDATKELTLTATDISGTADHHVWTLPAGTTVVTGDANNDLVLTVHLGNVAASNDALVFSCASVGGCGSSSKSLSIARAAAGTPKAITLTDALSATPTVGIKKLDAYTGSLKTRTLTLTATPNVTAGSEATSYKWVLPAAATVVDGTATAVEGQENTYTSTSASISVNLASVAAETSFVFKVYGVNGNGTSLLSKDLTCTSAAPKAPTAIFSGGTGSGTAFAYNPSCGTVTISVPAVLGVVNDFISVSGGAVLTSVSGNTATIDLSATSAVAKSTITIRAIASTATGSSSKDFVIKLGTPCGSGKMISEELVAEDFTVIAYPNPSASEFTIESSSKGATTVQVYDMMGRLIENAQANANSVQVGRNYAAGTYNVIVSQGAKAKTLKVIKK